jgi:hypothetical protein
MPTIDLQSFLDIPSDRLPLAQPRRRSRAWRRRARALDRWAAEEREAPLTFREHRRQAAVIRFDVWGNDPFPLGIRRRMVEHLVGIHDRWLERLSNSHPRPYLAIWLALPHVYNSQVVLATGDDQEHYEASVHVPGIHDTYATARTAPPSLYHGRPCDLSRFEWVHQVHRTVERLSWFSEKDWPALRREAVQVIDTSDGDTEVTLVSHDWLGRLPSAAGA